MFCKYRTQCISQFRCSIDLAHARHHLYTDSITYKKELESVFSPMRSVQNLHFLKQKRLRWSSRPFPSSSWFYECLPWLPLSSGWFGALHAEICDCFCDQKICVVQKQLKNHRKPWFSVVFGIYGDFRSRIRATSSYGKMTNDQFRVFFSTMKCARTKP